MSWLSSSKARPTADSVGGTGQARTTPAPSVAGNAVPHVVVDYAADQMGYAQTQAFLSEATNRLRGDGGGVYANAPGNAGEGRTFYGVTPGSPQRFVGAAALASNPVTYRETLPMIDNGTAEGPYADPARRIFAQRLARRSAQ